MKKIIAKLFGYGMIALAIAANYLILFSFKQGWVDNIPMLIIGLVATMPPAVVGFWVIKNPDKVN